MIGESLKAIIPSNERELTGGLMMVMMATPSAPTSRVVLPVELLIFFGSRECFFRKREKWDLCEVLILSKDIYCTKKEEREMGVSCPEV